MVTYTEIVNYLLKNGKFKNQLLIVENVKFSGILNFKRDLNIERFINISIQKKIDYIKKHYHGKTIKKIDPCIEKIEGNTIYFRSSRLFPTLYIDLIVLDELYKNKEITIVFKKLFIGYHILGLPFLIKSDYENANKCFSHWKKRFSGELKLSMLNKYKEFLNGKN